MPWSFSLTRIAIPARPWPLLTGFCHSAATRLGLSFALLVLHTSRFHLSRVGCAARADIGPRSPSPGREGANLRFGRAQTSAINIPGEKAAITILVNRQWASVATPSSRLFC